MSFSSSCLYYSVPTILAKLNTSGTCHSLHMHYVNETTAYQKYWCIFRGKLLEWINYNCVSLFLKTEVFSYNFKTCSQANRGRHLRVTSVKRERLRQDW